MADLACLIDSVQEVRHPRCVRSLMTRLAAVVVLLVLPTSTWAQCAGWLGTSDARMEFCAQEDQCPMHARADQPVSPGMMTQPQAHPCSALSHLAPSAPAGSSHLAPVTFI